MADKVRVGNTEIAMVWDAEFEYAPSQFLASMPAEKWGPYLDGVSPDEIQESRVMTFLIRSQGKNILVDAGVGAHGLWRFGEGHLPESLKELDVTPEEIDFVVPTHLHIDHVGWFTTSTPQGLVPTFPNARYLMQQEDWDFFVEQDYFANTPDSPLSPRSIWSTTATGPSIAVSSLSSWTKRSFGRTSPGFPWFSKASLWRTVLCLP